MFYKRRAKLKGKMKVYHQSDGTEELGSCIRGGFFQAANGVHLTVVL